MRISSECITSQGFQEGEELVVGLVARWAVGRRWCQALKCSLFDPVVGV